jgi:alcohol dehydrogenase class IV
MRGIEPFTIARLPRIVFGAHTIDTLPDHTKAFGTCALIVTGARWLRSTDAWSKLIEAMAEKGITCSTASVDGEPSPDLVDAIVAEHKDSGIDVVVAIGGGSAMDAAKAVAGLLRPGNSVMDHLEEVGRGVPYSGPAIPFIAVPTTPGTGTEATKNAVLSRRGPDGFKRSFRDDALVARVAIVDPQMLASCPKGIMAADGMDAFTQLLEGYVSPKANPMTDALAWAGLEAFKDGFFAAWEGTGDAAAAGRTKTAFASLSSGIVLAHTGLGVVHALASPLGAYFPIAHGLACGTLVAEATDVNIAALRARDPESPALAKYARVGRLVAGHAITNDDEALRDLVATLRDWTQRLSIPTLGQCAMKETDFTKVTASIRSSGMKSNPIDLGRDELTEILVRRI